MAEVVKSSEGITGSEERAAVPVRDGREWLFAAFASPQGSGARLTGLSEEMLNRTIIMRWEDWRPAHDLHTQGRLQGLRRPERFSFEWYDTDITAASTIEATFHEDTSDTVICLRESGSNENPAEWAEAVTLLKFRARGSQLKG